ERKVAAVKLPGRDLARTTPPPSPKRKRKEVLPSLALRDRRPAVLSASPKTAAVPPVFQGSIPIRRAAGGGSAGGRLSPTVLRGHLLRPLALFHLDVKPVLLPVSGHGEFQRRGLQALIFQMDGGAAPLAFLGQRRRCHQHLVFTFPGAVVVPVRAQLKRAVG